MKKTTLQKDKMLSQCKFAAWKALKISAIGLVAFAVGCSGEESSSDLSIATTNTQHQAEKKWDYGLYNLKTFTFTKAEDGHKSKWRDYLANTTLTNYPGVIFVRYEGRGAVAGTIEFDKQVTVHCKFNPKVKQKPFVIDSDGIEIDFKDYNGQDNFVSERFENPCVTLGGIYKITTKAEFKSDDEKRVNATLEYLFSRNRNIAKPGPKLSDEDIRKLATPSPVYDIPTKVTPSIYTPVKEQEVRDCHYYNNCQATDYTPVQESGYVPVKQTPVAPAPAVQVPMTYSATAATIAYGPAQRNVAPKTRFYDLRTLGNRYTKLSVRYTGSAKMHIDVEPKIVCQRRFDGTFSDNPLDRVGYTFRNVDAANASWLTEEVNLSSICGGLRGGIETFLIKGEPESYDLGTSARIELIAQ